MQLLAPRTFGCLLTGLCLTALPAAGFAPVPPAVDMRIGCQVPPPTPRAKPPTLPETAQPAAVEAVVKLHRIHMHPSGDPARAGDLYIERHQENARVGTRSRIWVRRDPFAYREEVEIEGATPSVFLSDGASAWRIREDGALVELKGLNAMALLEEAFRARSGYLDSRSLSRLGGFIGTVPVPKDAADDAPKDRRTVRVGVRTPSGIPWLYDFDAEDGRLHGMLELEADAPRWTRLAEWRQSGALTLPTLAVTGWTGRPEIVVMRTTRFEGDLSHPAALFPLQPPPPEVDGGPLEVHHSAIPGDTVLVLPAVTLNDGTVVAAMLDTGASWIVCDPQLAGRFQPLQIGAAPFSTGHGEKAARRLWLDSVAFGGVRLPPQHAFGTRVPDLSIVRGDDAPLAILGGDPLLSRSPVIDFRGKRLRLRSSPPRPLAHSEEPAINQPRVVTVPLEPRMSYGSVFECEVRVDGIEKAIRVLLDTGSGYVLRLTPSGLRKLGLPSDAASWEKRGGHSLSGTGAGGGVGRSIIVQIESVQVGPVLYESPWIGIFTGEGSPGIDGMLGCGALLPFPRVGIDAYRNRLEFELPPELEPGEDGLVRVPSPGRFLGVLLAPNRAGVGDGLPLARAAFPGTPAVRAGVRAGDWIFGVGDFTWQFPWADLNRSLWRRQGDGVEIRLVRPPGRRMDVLVR